ncbi:hypothetical protein [Burkholderia pseudomultivorans]|nr:hypothetical protein [Burkholderia pseudomultivorans]EGD00235.1 hypothetical protein B1M_32607 [Burkholderia sp. TJI49]
MRDSLQTIAAIPRAGRATAGGVTKPARASASARPARRRTA